MGKLDSNLPFVNYPFIALTISYTLRFRDFFFFMKPAIHFKDSMRIDFAAENHVFMKGKPISTVG